MVFCLGQSLVKLFHAFLIFSEFLVEIRGDIVDIVPAAALFVIFT